MIYLMHGFIGSGKTTRAREIENSARAIRFTPDEWMLRLYGENPPADRFREYLGNIFEIMESIWSQIAKLDGNVILDYGFWTINSRNSIVEKMNEYNFSYKWVILETDMEECKERNSKRALSAEKTIEISENTFDFLANQFESFDKKIELITNE